MEDLLCIENNKELLAKLVSGPPRKILVELTLMYLEDSDYRDPSIWKSICISCDVFSWKILSKFFQKV